MAANDTGHDLVPPKPVRPSWETAAPPEPRPAPAARPPAAPAAPPWSSAPPPPFTPPASTPPPDNAAAFDLAGNSLPGTSPGPTAYAPPASPYSGAASPAAAAWPPAPLGPAGATALSASSNRIPADKMLMGIALGLGVGLVGGIIIEKILFYAHFGLSLLYVLMGYGIGWSLHRVTGRGGAGMALLAVGLMVACLGVSHLVWAQDVLNQVRAAGNADSGATLMDALPVATASLGLMHWVCIGFGVLACYRGVDSQEG